MMCAFNCWSGCEASWCGPWDGVACEYPIIYSWFKYYSYTPGSGHNGSGWTLSDWDDFDSPIDDFKWRRYGIMETRDSSGWKDASP